MFVDPRYWPRGYQPLSAVHDSSTTLVRRARRELDQRAVVLKIIRPEVATPGAVARYRHELKVLQSLRIPGVIEVLGLEMVQGVPVLVLEDFGAESLARLHRRQRFGLERVLELAPRIAGILADVHDCGIVHGDINPANILLNQETGAIKLADFGASALLAHEPARTGAPGLVGTLAYMSPEQTGRTNRHVDYRTDFYSLGVTLYELGTGRQPFETDDPLELVHSHLARQPVPMHQVVHLDDEPGPEIPEALSQVVTKLMAKAPEDRYQSARGCAHDLDECRRRLQRHGRVDTFPLGQADHAERFQISTRLYGRGSELAALHASLARVRAGACELLLVTGYPGIGKSALVRDIAASVADSSAHFVEGKFDQYRRHVPHAALAQALSALIDQLLAEPEQRLSRWRDALREALAPNAQVLVEAIPSLQYLVGSQPAVPRLGPTESENRFHLVFQRFLEVLCSAEHPLILFLDDLQWADLASLRLLRLMLAGSDVRHLLVIGAYRDGEVDATHPLTTTLAQLRAEAVSIQQLTLGPLGIEHVQQLVADTLQREPEEVRELAALIRTKTGGNPFFVGQFLRALHQDGLLVYDRSPGRAPGWRWDLAAIQARGITDHVADLLIERMHKLPGASRSALELAACVGNLIDIDTLAIVCEDSAIAVHERLLPAITKGLIQPLSPPEARADSGGAPALAIVSHAFAHDRVQQAAYTLIDERDRAAVHLRIARLLSRALPAEERDRRLFELAEHFILGAALIRDADERIEVARMLLAAGRRAQASLAHETALRFLRAGLAIMPEGSWRDDYELTRDLSLAAIAASYVTGELDAAARLSDEALAQARDLLDAVEVYDIQLRFHFTQGQAVAAMEISLELLAMLGFTLPHEPEAMAAHEQGLRARLALDEADFEALEHLPVLADPHQATILRILMRAATATSFSNPARWRLLILSMTQHCMRHGHSALAPVGCAAYAALLCGPYQDIERGQRFADLAMRLMERFPDPQYEVRVRSTAMVMVRPWSWPLREVQEALQALVQRGRETGDLEYGMFCAIQDTFFQLVIGDSLEAVHRQALAYAALMERHGLSIHRDWVFACERLARALLGAPAPASEPPPAEYSPVVIKYEWYCRAMASYVMGDYAAARAAAERAPCELTGLAFLLVAEQVFIHSLSILATLPAAPERACESLAQVARNQHMFVRWVEATPGNFRSQHTLVEAERARARHDIGAAIELYERAIAGAREAGRMRDEALACERAASFHAGLHSDRAARAYLQDAYHIYRRWGAHAKVQRLEEQHPWLAGPSSDTRPPGATGAMGSSTSDAGRSLDIESVLRASQALSSQLVLEALLAELIKLIIANAGAQRGYLLLAHGDGLAIEAEGHFDTGVYRTLPSLSVEDGSEHGDRLARAAVSYVARTSKALVLGNAAEQQPFANDPHVRAAQTRSLLCAPIARPGALVGVIYLENDLAVDAFTPARVEMVQMLAAQAAISIENARLLETLRLSKEAAECAQADAERASRAKSEFLASVNHELRTPMNGIIGMIELLLGTALDDEQSDYLATARTSAEQLMRIIRDTLDLSRIEADRLDLEPIRFVLNDCLATLERMLTQRIRAKGLTFSRDVDTDVPGHLIGDRDRLLQVLINLIGNAIKFTPAGGAVSLRVRALERSAGQALLRFDVRDTGIGISAAEQALIFQPFTQVRAPDAPAGGSGLGLSIASRLVKLMGGTITVNSALGEGSCFSFTARFNLWQAEQPAQPEQRAHSIAPVAPAAAGGARGLRVLVVEDNPVNQLVAVRLLGMDEHTCVVAQNGAEALRKLESESFDALLMDVYMPVMDGHTTTREIRRREQGTGRHVPIIAVTASATTEIVEACAAAGMDHFLSKPLRIDALRDLLRQIHARP